VCSRCAITDFVQDKGVYKLNWEASGGPGDKVGKEAEQVDVQRGPSV
jgi:hypothetical protein